MTKAERARRTIDRGAPLVMPGVFDALSARIAVRAGFEVLFVSGYGVAATRLGLPDFGYLSAPEMAAAAAGICDAAGPVPVIVDADTGYGNALNVRRTVRELIRAGAAGVILEDQTWPKRCGHMRGKQVIPLDDQLAKLRAAREAARELDADLFLIGRTDARQPLGLDAAIERALAFREAGVDATFVEAPRDVGELEEVARRVPGRKLANMVERGDTPLLSRDELGRLGFDMIVHPLTALYSATRAMAEQLAALREHGTTRDALGSMVDFSEFNELIELEKHYRLEERDGPPGDDGPGSAS